MPLYADGLEKLPAGADVKRLKKVIFLARKKLTLNYNYSINVKFW